VTVTETDNEEATALDMRPTPSERLVAMGIDLPPVPEPVAAYLPTVRSGSLIWTSGQLPLVGGALPSTGKVGMEPGCVAPDQAAALGTGELDFGRASRSSSPSSVRRHVNRFTGRGSNGFDAYPRGDNSLRGP